jgi:hypothetical protein
MNVKDDTKDDTKEYSGKKYKFVKNPFGDGYDMIDIYTNKRVKEHLKEPHIADIRVSYD